MYIPNAFKIEDLNTLHEFIAEYSFATLVTTGAEPCVTHLPLLLDRERGAYGTLVGHFARPNPHWRVDHSAQHTVAMFHGPHAYVSPTWYRSGTPAVPTWNYAVVHAWGKMTVLDDKAKVGDIVRRMVPVYESAQPSPWNYEPALTAKMLDAIVGFELPIERLEGKFKLGQNRVMADQLGAIAGLEAAGDADSTALATFTRDRLKRVQDAAPTPAKD